MEGVLMRISASVPAKITLINAETRKTHCLHDQQLMHPRCIFLGIPDQPFTNSLIYFVLMENVNSMYHSQRLLPLTCDCSVQNAL